MKKILILAGLAIVFTGHLYAQCSNPYYQLKNGTFMVQENYDDKDKLIGRVESKVIDYSETATGFIATVNSKSFDKKDKLQSEVTYKCECVNGDFKIDMSAFVSTESMKQFEGMEFEITSDQLMVPANLTPGQTLPDGNFQLKTTSGPLPMSLIFDMTNRKVEGKESITTAAGTFDCVKISYDIYSKAMMVKMNMKAVQYLAEKAGPVKTMTYNAKGALLGYTILTKFE